MINPDALREALRVYQVYMVPFVACDMYAAMHGMGYPPTCMHPVFRAYDPRATNLALLGIHLYVQVLVHVEWEDDAIPVAQTAHFVS